MNRPTPAEGPRVSGLGRAVVSLVLALSAGAFFIILWGAYSTVDRLSSEAISRVSTETETQLHRFFEPVERNLRMALGWANNGELDPRDVEEMNRRFIPVLQNLPQVSSMLVATPEGVEYMLLKKGDEWVNRSTNVAERPGVTQWSRWTSRSRRLEEWSKEIDYDPRERPWFRGASDTPKGQLHWTEPYTFFTTKDPGITASSRVDTPDGELIIAFDVMLLDVSRFTTELVVSESGKVAVLTDSLEVLGLPTGAGFDDVEEIKKFVLREPGEIGVPDLDRAISEWDSGAEARFDFTRGGAKWLAAFFRYDLGERPMWIAIVAPASDFKGSLTLQRVALVALALFGLIGGLFVAIFYTRRYAAELENAVEEARDQLGQYQLQKKIGEGGMGSVYRASHMLMRREVAIKLVRADRVSGEFIKRFEREVRLTSKLSHPNTIQIYDYGRTPDGTFYYVMELLNGVSLAKFVAVAGRLPEGRVIYLLRQMCESLREAHAIGLIHRDIKPGNIHICERGGHFDFVKVLDFGLVKDVRAEEEEQQLTGESSFGTPGFVAPETIRDATRATSVSDIYSLGTVGYALLTATTIFDDRNRVQILLRQLKEEPEPPSKRIGRQVSADLEAIIMRMLRREPSDRYQEIDQVIDALDGCVDAHSWTQKDARQWWSEYPELFRDREELTLDETERPTIAVQLGERT